MTDIGWLERKSFPSITGDYQLVGQAEVDTAKIVRHLGRGRG